MSKRNVFDVIVEWFDARFGFAKTPLKPIPLFALNPIYWLGLLMALTFALQGLTGMFMLIYYVPSPDQAYSSTVNIINSIPLGNLVETLHLYTAYAMILLAFMHLIRNFFGSAHKEHRDLMWIVGILLGLTVLSFGVTGYLLPWTVISKSATDVAVGFVSLLPQALANLAKSLLTGSGSDADLLRRFVAVHTVVLPGTLAVLLLLKIYMYEVHGPAHIAAFGKLKVPGGKYVHWFPQLFLYATVLFSVFIAVLLATASLFPLSLPPEFNPATAGQYVVQPDWYLLWLYQILKFEIFEGTGAIYALGAASVFILVLLLLPFYDRSGRRELHERPLFTTVGTIILAEFVVLTVWGYLTPGQVIPDYMAVAVLGGFAVAVVILSSLIYRRIKATRGMSDTGAVPGKSKVTRLMPLLYRKSLTSLGLGRYGRLTVLFMAVLIVASVTLGSMVNMLPTLLLNVPIFLATVLVFGFSLYFMCWILRRLVVTYEKEVAVKA